MREEDKKKKGRGKREGQKENDDVEGRVEVSGWRKNLDIARG